MFNLNNVTVDDLVKRLPGGLPMLAKYRQQANRDRQVHVEAIAQAHTIGELKIHDALRKERAAFTAVQAKIAELRTVEQEHRRACRTLVSARFAVNQEIAVHERALRDTADLDSIRAFRTDLLTLREQIRRAGRSDERPSKKNPFSGQRDLPPTVFGNSRGVMMCLEAVRAAIEACDALPLQIHEDLPAEIARIRALIPLNELKVFQEIGPASGPT
jgi:hypothetical protein